MRKLILQMQMSVDGFVGSAASSIPWQIWDWGPVWTWDRKLRRDFNEVLASVDCILLSGPMAQEGYLTHWERTAQAHASDPDYDFARRIVAARKVVFSRHLERSRWKRTTVARRPLAEAVRKLKRGDGGALIAFGGTGFATSLIAAKLVDEFQLFVNPAVLGKGESIFAQTSGLPLKMRRSTAYACGMVVQCYAPEWTIEATTRNQEA